jgi:signal peptide peptidase SppA
MINAAQWILAHRWAIEEKMLMAIVGIASREASVDEFRQALASKPGEDLAGGRRITARDGIATIPICGPIFPRANMFTMMSGATSAQSVAYDLQVALDSNDVQGIILNIDSPGGEVTGINELALQIRAARQVKPIVAYGMGKVASAAYWLGSAAGSVVVEETAEVGSIGVVSVYTDSSRQDEKSGVERIQIVSSVSPDKRPDPKTETGKAQIQALVDSIGEIFVSTVAQNRGVSVDKVLSDFGKGGLFVGKNAVEQGMADSVGTYESVFADMKEKVALRNNLFRRGL